MWKERIFDKDEMPKCKNKQISFCLFGPLISWWFDALNENIYIYIFIYLCIFDHLVRASIDREGKSKSCQGANCSCEVCDSLKDITKS